MVFKDGISDKIFLFQKIIKMAKNYHKRNLWSHAILFLSEFLQLRHKQKEGAKVQRVSFIIMGNHIMRKNKSKSHHI
jgi:hypothetical protein